MATVTPAMVKEIREITGAGMLDCKKALEEAGGDLEKAKVILREKGLAAAAKKAGRVATEGMVQAFVQDGNVGVLVEINSETDFVAKNDLFREFAAEVATQIAQKNPTHVRRDEVPANAEGVSVLLEQTSISNENLTIEQLLNEKIAKIGENITIRRFVRYQSTGGSVIESYIHGGGKIGVLVEIASANGVAGNQDAIRELARELAMQIAAENPKYIERSEVPSDELDKEKEILRNQALNEGKPEKIVDKMVEGRISKYYEEVCLLEQTYFRNQDLTIVQLLKDRSTKIGDTLSIASFTRFQLGEGLEKKQDDFVAEVMAQTKL